MTSGDAARSNGHADGRTIALFDLRVENVAEARSWMHHYLAQHPIPVGTIDDAVLIVSELVTNALLHGLGAAVLRASLLDHSLRVSVTDSGDQLPEQRPIDLAHIGGLGLHIVDRLASAWGVSPFPGGKTVWAVVPVPD